MGSKRRLFQDGMEVTMIAPSSHLAQNWILNMKFASPIGTCQIKLGKPGKGRGPGKRERKTPNEYWSKCISAATFAPDGSLWLATDEHSHLLRLTPAGDDFVLRGVFPLNTVLADAPSSEIDIEGLAADKDYLWVTGSHSSVMKMPPDGSPAELEKAPKELRLASTRVRPGRKLIARLPFSEEGVSRRVKSKKKSKRFAAMLPIRRDETELTRALRRDPHIGPFIAAGIPCKANGLDIEGLATAGGKVYFGLRGPVIDDWAILLEIEPSEKSTTALRLAPRKKNAAPYRKIFLKLGGLGVRDLTIHGDTLYILAGPSMSLDGPVCLFAIPKFTKAAKRKAHKLEPILHLPFAWKADHPESIVIIPGEKQDRLLVICDNPADDRLKKSGSIRCELYALPR
jgi:hypothetical protein